MVERGHVGVRRHDPDVFHLHAQFLGRDLGQDGIRTLAYIHRAAEDLHRPVFTHLDKG